MIDLDAVTAEWLQQCGMCDVGLPTLCTCPTADHRPVMLALVNELIVNRAELRNATADRAALDVAVTRLRELETKYDAIDSAFYPAGIVADLSALLDKIGGTRE